MAQRNAIQRLDAADELVTLLSRCIRLGHPKRDAMMDRYEGSIDYMLTLTDEQMDAMRDRLDEWLASRQAALVAARAVD